MTAQWKFWGWGAVAVSVFAGPACGPSYYGQVQPKIERWEVAQTPHSTTNQSAGKKSTGPNAAESAVVSWKDIVIGQTPKTTLEERHGPGNPHGDHVEYKVDTIVARVTFSKDGLAERIEALPPVAMDEKDVVAAYGEADQERRSDDFIRIWEYDGKGLTVTFAPDDASVSTITYRASTAREERVLARVKSSAPSRPPLTNLVRSLASVRQAATIGGTSFNWVGANEEYSQAQQMYSLIHRQWPVVTDREMQRYLNGVMDRLTSVTPQPPFPWTIRVVDASSLNAMNLGGGIILLNSGLFKHLDSEAQLAYVVAHEMGHQIRQHLAKIQSKQKFSQLLLGAAVLATAGAGHPEAARAINSLGSLAAGATLASFSRKQEIEADDLGFHILVAAEYDPAEAEKVMEKFIELKALQGPSIPLFSTHPEPEARLVNIQRLMRTTTQNEDIQGLISTEEFQEFRELYRY